MLIDFNHRVQHHEGRILDKVKDVVDLFMTQEQMSRQTAYDYAKAILAIQNAMS